MPWYEDAVFYHIYPLGLAGAPALNAYEAPVSRLPKLEPWIDHIKKMGFNALYIGPLFESVGHGYETTDYRKLDSRLGTNEDLKHFVKHAHDLGVRVIFDGVFNHTGRDFFAFKDIQARRENSPYKDWYRNVNFSGNNEYNDGFSYDNWGGYNLMAKLNQQNLAVFDYIADTIRFWVDEFDVDGIRLDAADVMDFEFLKGLRRVANEVKPDFWLMGEVIHGDYSRWANGDTLHSVTNYNLYKALWSGHNEHNYFEIAHTVRRLNGMLGDIRLYNFVDNHDVDRITSKLNNPADFVPVHVLLFSLPGIPSVFYGSEFGFNARKGADTDAPIRPCLDLSEMEADEKNRAYEEVVAKLASAHRDSKALCDGSYDELMLTNRQFAIVRRYGEEEVIAAVNNDDNPFTFQLPAKPGLYKAVLSGDILDAGNGQLEVTVPAHSGEIFLNTFAAEPEADQAEEAEAEVIEEVSQEPAPAEEKPAEADKTDENSAEEPEAALEKPEETETAAAEEPAETEPAAEEAETKEPVQEEAESAAAQKEEKPARKSVSLRSILPAAEKEEKEPESTPVSVPADKPLEEMSVPELQAVILEKLAANGPVTEQMKKDVAANVWPDSLLNWARSFH